MNTFSSSLLVRGLASALALGTSLGVAQPAPTSPGVPAAPRWTAESLQALIEPLVQQKRSAGVAVGFIAPGQRFVVTAGASGRPERPQIDGDTLFEIGSITKALTGMLLADAVARGEVRLDAPIAPQLAAWAQKIGEPRLAQNAELGAVTWRQLTTHRAGIPRIPMTHGPMIRSMLSTPSDPYAGYTEAHLAEYFAKLKPEQNAAYEYSNSGGALLGQLLAQLPNSGQSYPMALRTRVLEPIGLRDTWLEVPAEHQARWAIGHDAKGAVTPHWALGVFSPTGGLKSSANDMLKLLEAALANREPIARAAQQLEPLGKAGGIGMNWHQMRWLNADGSKDTLVWHNGGTFGSNSFIGFDAARGIGVVVLLNSGAMGLADEIGAHLWDARSKAPQPTPKASIKAMHWFAGVLGLWVGASALRRGLLTLHAGQPRDAWAANGWKRWAMLGARMPGFGAAPFTSRLEALVEGFIGIGVAVVFTSFLPFLGDAASWALRAAALAPAAAGAWSIWAARSTPWLPSGKRAVLKLAAWAAFAAAVLWVVWW